MNVKNVNGTSDTNCKCGTWLKHWEKFSGKSAVLCSASNCFGFAEIGAHVQKAEGNDNSWYIVPFCKLHNNQRSGEVSLKAGTILVPANKSITCGRA